jgi:aspartokinase
MRVLKFGGTSVGSAAALENVVAIVRQRRAAGPVAVVVSALAGITTQLDGAATRRESSVASAVFARHEALLVTLTGTGWGAAAPAAEAITTELERRLRTGERSDARRDAALGCGERLSAILVAELLRRRGIAAAAIDGTEVVRTDARHGRARVDPDATRRLLLPRLERVRPAVPVITGYTGSTCDGAPTTLGRGGSDITAGVVGALTSASEVEIWTDVDGIYDRDPRYDPAARLLRTLSWGEALRHALAGAKVLHPETIPPLAGGGIRLSIRNTFAPDRPGTMIGGAPTVELFVAGATGNVGGALWRQIARLDGIPLHVRGVANSRKTFVGDAASPEVLAERGIPKDWTATLRSLEPRGGAQLLFVDCTPSDEVAALYAPLLERGIGVVTANKIAGAGPGRRWEELRSLASRRRLPLRYETTVGAALPILDTARSLAATGDRVIALDAVLSGTLSFVLGRLHEGLTFSDAVSEAVARGLSEPDPLADLSGEDVARKLVILLRDLGLGIERNEVCVEPLAATAREVAANDAVWRQRVERAEREGRRLVYAASFAEGIARAGVRELALDDPMARLRPGENIVVFTTERYRTVPLTVMGPGAGADVTAAGVLAEILDVAREGVARA